MALMLFSGCSNSEYFSAKDKEKLLCQELGYNQMEYSSSISNPSICHNGDMNDVKEISYDYVKLWWKIEGETRYTTTIYTPHE